MEQKALTSNPLSKTFDKYTFFIKLLKSHLCGTIILYLLTFSTQNNAQTPSLEIGAELRPRMIIDNGYKTPKTQDDDIIVYASQRTRLNASFAYDKIETYISLQDVRLWGNDDNYKSSGIYGNTESICLHQAWAKLEITKELSLKIGRQRFSYDDQRIISARNWNNYQVTYDALLAEHKIGKSRLHLGISYNADNKKNRLFPDEKFKTFDFIHYQHNLENFTFSGITVLTGNTLSDTTTKVFYRNTYGANANYKNGKNDIRLSAYYQHNINNNGGNVSAFCFSIFAKRQLLESLSLGVGMDYLSGNDETSLSTTNHRFDILYGRRHGWYGYMDYFSTTPQQGLQDYMLKTTYKPHKNITLFADYHYFMLASDKLDISNTTETLARKLGHEFDLKMKWKMHPVATLECGYSIYKVTETLKQVKNVSGKNLKHPQFGYVMLTIKPFYSYQKGQ